MFCAPTGRQIEELQKQLFENRKQLAALSSEPITERPGELADSRPRVFISYHHADQQWLERLLAYLKPLERDAVLEIWVDKQIESGGRWREQIESELQAAKVAVLLVSADYLASDYIIDRELLFLLEGPGPRRPYPFGDCQSLPIRPDTASRVSGGELAFQSTHEQKRAGARSHFRDCC